MESSSILATGLCRAACGQNRRVRFTTAATLVNELVDAKQNNQVWRRMARWQKYELIALAEGRLCTVPRSCFR
jgi:DNA replication protein DnaC